MTSHKKKGKKHPKSDLARLNQKYWEIYNKWGKVLCPALKKNVHFTNKGWQHIQQDKSRTGVEKEKRLNLLLDAKHIIETTTFYQEKRFQPYRGTFHEHYGIIALYNGRKIKVVLIEDRGQIDYLSVHIM